MPEIRTVTKLRRKRDEISASIRLYERKLEQARADLACWPRPSGTGSFIRCGCRNSAGGCIGRGKGVSVWAVGQFK